MTIVWQCINVLNYNMDYVAAGGSSVTSSEIAAKMAVNLAITKIQICRKNAKIETNFSQRDKIRFI